MIARACVVAEAGADSRGGGSDDGSGGGAGSGGSGASGTRLVRLRSEPPLVLRPTTDALFLVGGAAGPLGGDRLSLDVSVGPGAALTVCSAAASVVLPGPSGGTAESVLQVTAQVGAGATLCWSAEPTVLVEGCRHRVEVHVEVAAGGRMVWREELLLGRSGERGGSVVTRLSVDVDGRPLLRQELALGPDHPAAATPAVTRGAQAVGTVTFVDDRLHAVRRLPAEMGGPGGCSSAVLGLDGPGAQVVALAPDRIRLSRLLDAATEAVSAARRGDRAETA